MFNVCAGVPVTAGSAAGRRGSQSADHLGRMGAGRHRPWPDLPGGHPPDPLLHLPSRGELSPRHWPSLCSALVMPPRSRSRLCTKFLSDILWTVTVASTQTSTAEAVVVLDGLFRPPSASLQSVPHAALTAPAAKSTTWEG